MVVTASRLCGLVACLSLAACQGTDAPAATGTQTQEPVLVMTAQGETYQAYAFHPETGLRPWGTPLPQLTSYDGIRFGQSAGTDRALVVVSAPAPQPGEMRQEWAFLGNGTNWQQVGSRLPKMLQPSADLELIWMAENLGGGRVWRERLWEPNGQEWLNNEPVLQELRTYPLAFSPHNDWVALLNRDQISILRNTGERTVISEERVSIRFADVDSLVISKGSTGTQTWIDLQGQELQREGFLSASGSVDRSGIQQGDGRISRIINGRVVDFGPSPEPDSRVRVWIADDETLLVARPGGLELRKQGGTTYTFLPAPTPSYDPPEDAEVFVQVEEVSPLKSANDTWRIGVSVLHTWRSVRQSHDDNAVLYLWIPDGRRNARVQAWESRRTEGNFRMTAFGLCWVWKGQLHWTPSENADSKEIVQISGTVLGFL